MTSFIKHLQGRSPNGPELRKFKDQAASIAGALFRFAAAKEGRTFQIGSGLQKPEQLVAGLFRSAKKE
jgi:hypothetical protein